MCVWGGGGGGEGYSPKVWSTYHNRANINVVFGQNELVKFLVVFCHI